MKKLETWIWQLKPTADDKLNKLADLYKKMPQAQKNKIYQQLKQLK